MAKPWAYSDLKPCGTIAAFRRHYRHDEEPCESCRQAASRERVNRYALRKRQVHRVMDEDQFRDFLLEEVGVTNFDAFFIRHALPVEQVLRVDVDGFRVTCDGTSFIVDRVKGGFA